MPPRSPARLPVDHDKEMRSESRRTGIPLTQIISIGFLAIRDWLRDQPDVKVIDMEAIYKNQPKRK